MSSDLPPSDSESRRPYANLRVEDLQRATQVYLRIAYEAVEIPAPVKKRLEWRVGEVHTVLAHPPFEKVGKSPTGEAAIYALRLGNAQYPHMKMQIQPWTGAEGFLLSVNTHDQVLALDPNSPDAPAFRALQAENLRLKQLIEQAWDEAGLPIFLRFLRDYLKQKPG